MPKSREFIDSSDSEDAQNTNKNESVSDKDSAVAATSTKSKVKTSNSKNDPSAKRAKTTDKNDGDVASTTGLNGERLYEIGKLRYVSVSEYRGKSYVNIREYYEDKGVEKPGRKGISLTGDQWEKLKSLINQVDKDFKKSK